MSKVEQARNYFKQGYNCAQSVLLVYAEDCGLTKDTALKLASSFGGGMGRLREVCGAVSAMFMVAGLKYGYVENDNDAVKAEHYVRIQNLANEFKSEHRSIICRDLLNLSEGVSEPTPAKRTAQYYEERPCEMFIEKACELLEKL